MRLHALWTRLTLEEEAVKRLRAVPRVLLGWLVRPSKRGVLDATRDRV